MAIQGMPAEGPANMLASLRPTPQVRILAQPEPIVYAHRVRHSYLLLIGHSLIPYLYNLRT